MPTTSQLLTWAEEQCHGWLREGSRGSRALLNEAHRLLLTGERKQFLVFNTAIGNLPFLATQAGVYIYNMPDTIWKVKHIVQDITLQTNADPWRYEDIILAGNRYYRILNVDTRQAVHNNTVATVMFSADPFTTTQQYRYYGWRWPLDITSDRVQHEMPGTTDEEYLLPATIKLIEAIDHGNFIEAQQYITKELKPKIGFSLDSGEHGVPKFVTRRPF